MMWSMAVTFFQKSSLNEFEMTCKVVSSCTLFVVPLLSHLGRKLAGELQNKDLQTAAFCKVHNYLIFVSYFATYSVEPKIPPHTASQMLWWCDCPLRTAFLGSVLHLACSKQHNIIILIYRQFKLSNVNCGSLSQSKSPLMVISFGSITNTMQLTDNLFGLVTIAF